MHLAFLYIMFPRMPDRLIGGQSTPLHYSQVRCTGEQESLLDCQLSEITTGCIVMTVMLQLFVDLVKKVFALATGMNTSILDYKGLPISVLSWPCSSGRRCKR